MIFIINILKAEKEKNISIKGKLGKYLLKIRSKMIRFCQIYKLVKAKYDR